MTKRLALAALPFALLTACSSSNDGTASAPISTSSTTSVASATASSSTSIPSASSSTASRTPSSTSSPAVAITAPTTPSSATALQSQAATPSTVADPRRPATTAAKTADCTNLGTGKHYPCTQAEYDAINEADEPPIPATPTLPTAAVCGNWDKAVRPSSMLIMCGDGSEGLSNIHWTSWAAQGASATGIHFQRICEPNCAQGRDATTPVTIRLSGPVKTATGLAFSTMTVTGQRVHTVPLLTAN